MATITITNLTNEPVLLQELYTTLLAGESMSTERFKDDLHSTPRIQELWADGVISVTVTPEPEETSFIESLLHTENAVTRTYHEPTLVPTDASNAPGQQASLGAIGDSTIVAEFTADTDEGYKIFKIPRNFVGDAAFHIHWTKESGVAGDTDQSGNTVQWRISYLVFPGSGSDLTAAPTVLDITDTYTDSGTTTRIVERTPNTAASGFVANYYVSMKVEVIGAGTTLTCEPALVNVDLTFTEYINQ